MKLSEIKIHKQIPKRSLVIFAALLFLLSFITSYYFKVQPFVSNQQKMLQAYIHKQEEDGKELLNDTALMRKLVLKSESIDEFEKIADKEYGVFLFAETISENQDLLFWNNQKILPPNADFDLPDGKYFQHLANGYYVVYKTTLHFKGMSNNIVAYVLIPVLNEYYLQTDYLLTQFVHDKDAMKQIALSSSVTEYPIRSVDNEILFYIKGVSYTNVVTKDKVTIILRITAMVLLLFYFHLVAETLTRKKRALYGIVFLFVCFLVFRLILYQFPGLFALRQFYLFNPTIYATNNFNSSLGDLLINSILITWLVLFTWYNIGPVQKIPSFLKDRLYAAGIIAVFVLIYSTFQLANIVRSLVADSKISFNVTDFFGLDVFTVIGLIVLALLFLHPFQTKMSSRTPSLT